MGGVAHTAKAGALLTGAEYEDAAHHVVTLSAADVGAAADNHDHTGVYSGTAHTHAYAADTHDHDADYAATDHAHAAYSGTAHTHDYAATVHTHDAYSGTAHTHPGGSEAFPVGSVFIAVVSTNPATLLGYGTWAAFGAGRVLVGLDSGDTDFDTVKETGGAKTKAISAHSGAAVADHAAHTHSYSTVLNHTHDVTVTDPGHVHLLQRYPTATGTSSGFTADTSMSGTPADTTLNTKSNTTGITATTANPAGGAASGTTGDPSATLTHSVTQPSAHTDLNVVQPYIVVYMWERTA